LGWKKNPDFDGEGRIFLPCCEFNYVPFSSNCPLPTRLRGVTFQHKHTKERNREREKYMHKLHLAKKDTASCYAARNREKTLQGILVGNPEVISEV
jgi:hypothetical protein